MSTDTLWAVAEFNRAFEMYGSQRPHIPVDRARETIGTFAVLMGATGRLLKLAAAHHDKDPMLLRLQLLQEELGELAEAIRDGDLLAALDALCDIQYVLDSATLALGMQDIFKEAFDEVHRANMSKLGTDGRPVKCPAGRVKKGPNYKGPDLRPILTQSLM